MLIASAFVLSLAFPGFVTAHGIGILAFVALIPVFMVVRSSRWSLVWLYGFIFGFFYYLFFNYWLKTFHPLAILIVPIIKGGEMVLLFLALKGADSYFRKHGYIIQSLVWVSYAYLLETWFAGYPYGTIAYAAHGMLWFIQSADIFGIWGIVFLMVLPQAFLGRVLMDKLRDPDKVSVKAFFRTELPVVIIYAVLMVANLIYGIVKTNEWEDKEPQRIWRVAAVQHNHDSWKGGLRTYRMNFNNLRRYTLESVRENPDIVIWSETAFVPSVDWNRQFPSEKNKEMRDLIDDFVEFGTELDVPLLTGNADGEAKDPDYPEGYFEDGSINRKDYNSVILFKDGEIAAKYRKQHLVPFTEHFPYEKQLPWLYKLLLANDYNWWEEGTDPLVFEADGVHFSTPICFEDVFGYLPAGFVRNGADVIVNMTNDSWSGSVAAARQHEYIAVFRSIETRKSTVRGTNSGMSCMITPEGRIHDEMTPFKAGHHIYDVPVYDHSEGNTFYVEHVDLFARIAVGLSGALLLVGAGFRLAEVIRKKKEK